MTAALSAPLSADDNPAGTSGLAHRLMALAPVARALRRTAHHAPDPIAALTRRLDLATYRSILAHPCWSLIRQALIDTRSYDRGLDAGLRLLSHTDTYRDVLAPRELEAHVTTLGLFVLEMLDRLDDWEGYLATWHLLRTHTACSLTYERAARFTQGPRMTPFILGEDARGLRVHVLYLAAHRQAVIARKLDRQRRGAKLGNLWHATQDELSEAEIRERLEAVAQLAREAAGQR